ncbi:MAG: hypothetical protein QW460_03965, partial [Thermoplasmatales archaeon]
SEYNFARQSVILRGLHLKSSQGPAGKQKVSIHFLEMFGSPTSIFRTTALPGLPTDQSASDLAVDTLFGLVNPLLELLRSTKAMSGNRKDQSQQLIALRKSEEKLKAQLEPLAPLPTSANSSVTEFFEQGGTELPVLVNRNVVFFSGCRSRGSIFGRCFQRGVD